MMIIVEEPPAYLLKQLEALLSLPIASPPSREEVEDKAVEAPDRDDLLHGYEDGVVQLRHDGSLPLQVLGDIGDVEASPPSEPQNEIVGQLCHVWQVGVSL